VGENSAPGCLRKERVPWVSVARVIARRQIVLKGEDFPPAMFLFSFSLYATFVSSYFITYFVLCPWAAAHRLRPRSTDLVHRPRPSSPSIAAVHRPRLSSPPIILVHHRRPSSPSIVAVHRHRLPLSLGYQRTPALTVGCVTYVPNPQPCHALPASPMRNGSPLE